MAAALGCPKLEGYMFHWKGKIPRAKVIALIAYYDYSVFNH